MEEDDKRNGTDWAENEFRMTLNVGAEDDEFHQNQKVTVTVKSSDTLWKLRTEVARQLAVLEGLVVGQFRTSLPGTPTRGG